MTGRTLVRRRMLVVIDARYGHLIRARLRACPEKDEGTRRCSVMGRNGDGYADHG